jgi:homoserine dehydrogenase
VQGLNEGLAANRIQRIYGILNGTTNYILTRMSQEGMSFGVALKAAQKAGFAEANPAFDIHGTDAAHKLAVLSSLATGDWVHMDEVATEGIAKVDVWDVQFAERHLGRTLKLLGIGIFSEKQLSVRVHPTLIKMTHPFANVSQEYNAVIVHGDTAGDVMFYGKGAGQMPAASAVVSDVMYLARQVANGTAGQIPYVVYKPHKLKRQPFDNVMGRHYLRFNTIDKPGVLAKLTHELGSRNISIASVHQEPLASIPTVGVPIVVITHKSREGDVQDALAHISKLSFMRRRPVHLRIEDF